MTSQSIIIKTSRGYTKDLVSIFASKGFTGATTGLTSDYPYMILREESSLRYYLAVIKEAKGNPVYYVHPRYFNSIQLIPREAVIEFIKSIGR